MPLTATMDTPLGKVVGAKTADALADALELRTVGDLLRHYPRRYAERGDRTDLAALEIGDQVTVLAEVRAVNRRSMRNRRGSLLEVIVGDGNRTLSLTFFNQAWRERELKPGRWGLFAGKVTDFRGKRQLNGPDYRLLPDPGSPEGAEAIEEFAGAIIPVYPAAAKLPSWTIARCVRIALDTLAPTGDPLPAELRARHKLADFRTAIHDIHRPGGKGELYAAIKRLKWEEAFGLQVVLVRRKNSATAVPATPRPPRGDGLLAAFDADLPFALTDGQREVGDAIAADLTAPHPMHRLLQGEVGSGKAQPLDARVLTPTGFRRMGDLRTGDRVITMTGEPALVAGVYPQGERDVYRVHLSDGTSAECDREHLWVVNTADRDRRGDPPKVLSLREIAEDLTTADGTPKWRLPLAEPADLDSGTERPADPYALGRRLADGRGAAQSARRDGPDAGVPEAYKAAPVDVRHAILQGLLDAAGRPADDRDPDVSFHSPSGPLAEDVAWLAASLGGTGHHRRVRDRDGTRHRVSLRLPGRFPPFRLPGAAPAAGNLAPVRAVVAVEPVGRRPVQCIAVDHPTATYVTDDFIVTHNTIVSVRAMLQVVDTGGQAALLAPTEVLAAQHHRTIVDLLGDRARGGELDAPAEATRVTLVTGSQGAKARRAALAQVADGTAGIAVGTHALLYDAVDFHDLGLVVVDEQHRFGVEQRDALRAKADVPPHVLVMTATPIPRTVAMTVYGDLEISSLSQLPKGRSPITTHVVPGGDERWMRRTWQRIREEVEAGHQAYVVAPRIGGDEDADPKRGAKRGAEDDGRRPPVAVLDVAPGLADGVFHDLRVGVLHGRLPAEEKDAVMRAFGDGELDVVVATTVIEVGVDVPNATMMVILDADRFGVSQLHQLRGRVGRGSAPGLCLLVTEAGEGTPAAERLAAVADTADGFRLAELDLEQRREGDVLGEAQSGRRSQVRLLSLIRDAGLIREAREEAIALVAEDPDLTGHPDLAAATAALVDDERAEYLEKG